MFCRTRVGSGELLVAPSLRGEVGVGTASSHDPPANIKINISDKGFINP